MKRDKMCCDCEHAAMIRGVPWVRLCQLHAAAPDLLEAAKSIQSFWDGKIKNGVSPRLTVSLIAKLSAAIAKTEAR